MSSKIPENHNQLNHVGLPVNANFFIIQGSNIRKSVLLINKLVYFHESYLSGCDLSPRWMCALVYKLPVWGTRMI